MDRKVDSPHGGPGDRGSAASGGLGVDPWVPNQFLPCPLFQCTGLCEREADEPQAVLRMTINLSVPIAHYITIGP